MLFLLLLLDLAAAVRLLSIFDDFLEIKLFSWYKLISAMLGINLICLLVHLNLKYFFSFSYRLADDYVLVSASLVGISFSLVSIVLLNIQFRFSLYESLYMRGLYNEATDVILKQERNIEKIYVPQSSLSTKCLVYLATLYLNIGQSEKAKSVISDRLYVVGQSKRTQSSEATALHLKMLLAKAYMSDRQYEEAGSVIAEISHLAKEGESDIFVAEAQTLKAAILLSREQYQQAFKLKDLASKQFQQLMQKWESTARKYKEIRQGNVLYFTERRNLIAISFYVFCSLVAFALTMFPIFNSVFPYVILGAGFFAFYFLLSCAGFYLNSLELSNSNRNSAVARYCTAVSVEIDLYKKAGDFRSAYNSITEIDALISNCTYNTKREEKLEFAQLYLEAASVYFSESKIYQQPASNKRKLKEIAAKYLHRALYIYEAETSFITYAFSIHRHNYIRSLLQETSVSLELEQIDITEATKRFSVIYENVRNDKSGTALLIYVNHMLEFIADQLLLGNYFYVRELFLEVEELIEGKPVGYGTIAELSFIQSQFSLSDGDITQALMFGREGVAQAMNDLLLVLPVISEKHRISMIERVRFFINRLISLSFDSKNDTFVEVEKLFEIVVRSKSLTSEVLLRQRISLPDIGSYNLSERVEILNQLKRKIASIYTKGIGPAESFASYSEKMSRLKARVQKLEAELSREYPELNLKREILDINRYVVAEALPKGSVLVEIVLVDLLGSKAGLNSQISPSETLYYLAFVLNSGQSENINVVNIGQAIVIDEMIHSFKDAIVNSRKKERRTISLVDLPGSEQESVSIKCLRLGVALREKVFDPFLSLIGNKKHLFITPDGQFWSFSFGLLMIEADTYLLDRYKITYLTSSREVLTFSKRCNRKTNPPVVIADPAFDHIVNQPEGSAKEDKLTREERAKSYIRKTQPQYLKQRNITFNRLSAFAVEGEKIAAVLGVAPTMSEKATKEFLQSVESPIILHIATHGFFIEDDSYLRKDVASAASTSIINRDIHPLLESGLALAGANSSHHSESTKVSADSNGIITAEEVSQLSLIDTNLVVLSACGTGLGKVYIGEGVFGLRRSFFVAGAKSLIMSLWSVPDEETKDLMVNFYSRIVQGETFSEALQNAQKDVRSIKPAPYFWGAFVYQGNPDTVLIE